MDRSRHIVDTSRIRRVRFGINGEDLGMNMVDLNDRRPATNTPAIVTETRAIPERKQRTGNKKMSPEEVIAEINRLRGKPERRQGANVEPVVDARFAPVAKSTWPIMGFDVIIGNIIPFLKYEELAALAHVHEHLRHFICRMNRFVSVHHRVVYFEHMISEIYRNEREINIPRFVFHWLIDGGEPELLTKYHDLVELARKPRRFVIILDCIKKQLMGFPGTFKLIRFVVRCSRTGITLVPLISTVRD